MGFRRSGYPTLGRWTIGRWRVSLLLPANFERRRHGDSYCPLVAKVVVEVAAAGLWSFHRCRQGISAAATISLWICRPRFRQLGTLEIIHSAATPRTEFGGLIAVWSVL